MAPDTKQAFPATNLQRATNYILQKRQISQRYAQERNYREKTHKHGTYVSIVLGVVLACHSLLHPIQMYGQSSKD